MSDKPQPVKYTNDQGGDWINWVYLKEHHQAHAILFDDGSLFDITLGWRQGKYCPGCGRKIDV